MSKLIYVARFLKISWFAVIAIKNFRKFKHISTNETAKRQEITVDFVNSLVELGPTFVKIGQILSTRPEIVPQEYITQLQKLQESVPPFSFDEVNRLIKQEFGKEVSEVFVSVDQNPVASVSLSQVHFGVLKDGNEVAIKVQRPDIRNIIEQDMIVIAWLIRQLNRLFPHRARRLNLLTAFEEFKRYTLQELDFTLEAHTMERFAKNFAAWNDVVFPKVFWEHTTTKILTMERMSGLRLSEVPDKIPLKTRQSINRRLLEMEMKMFISDGFFHADLHPGNILFTEDGRIVLLDFGMYGELSEEHRDHFILYWLAAVQKQLKRAFYHLVKQTNRLKDADEKAFYKKFKELAKVFYESTISEKSLTQTYLDIIVSGSKFGFIFSSDLLLHAKALTTAESLAFTLMPNLKFEQEAKPIIIREFAKRVSNLNRLKSQIENVLPELLLFGELPPSPLREEAAPPFPKSVWNELMTAVSKNIKEVQKYASVLKNLFNPLVSDTLRNYYSQNQIDSIIDYLWLKYLDLEPSVPIQPTTGGEINVHLAAMTIALYYALVAAGQTKENAAKLIYDITWSIYTKMGDLPWIISGILTQDSLKRLRLAIRSFLSFPFNSPSYLWQDVDSEPSIIAFNCHKCPVAEYFKSQGLAELCVNTWCNLDYPLARQWGAKLERSGCIAGGAKVCDFRWRAVLES